MHDAAAITKLAQEAGARVVVDGVAYAPHRVPDTAAIGADAYCYSAYKTFAAHQGVMAVKDDWLDALENQGHFFNGIYPDKKLVPSGPQHAEIICMSGLEAFYSDLYTHHFGAVPKGRACEWVGAVQDMIHAHEVAIATPLMEFLREEARIRLIGPECMEFGKRAPTISFTAEGVPARDVTAKLAEVKIGASAGHYYAWRLMEALGIAPEEGVVRLSLVAYNTEEEVARAVAAIKTVLQ
jgi:selenocysteine lyase/cysteine desulfurase